MRSGESSDRFVVPKKEGDGWDVIKSGHRRATGHANTRSEAIKLGRRMIEQDGGGELRVMNTSGKLVDSRKVAAKKSK